MVVGHTQGVDVLTEEMDRRIREKSDHPVRSDARFLDGAAPGGGSGPSSVLGKKMLEGTDARCHQEVARRSMELAGLGGRFLPFA